MVVELTAWVGNVHFLKLGPVYQMALVYTLPPERKRYLFRNAYSRRNELTMLADETGEAV